MNLSENKEIRLFREYLKIPTVHPNIDYAACLAYLEKQAAELQLPVRIYYPAPLNPILIITWEGTEPDLPSIWLHSHMDVVPVYEAFWTHPPFDADIDDQGRIFARGAQDMKCVGAQYLGAIRALRREGVQLKRTVHAAFAADEERGGFLAMTKFVQSDEFKNLNIGFALDEGLASSTDSFSVFYAERTAWGIVFKCSGTDGHGSLLHKNTAAEKVRIIINKLLDYRATQVARLESDPNLQIGDVTTVNLTMLRGGIQDNVVPPEMTIGFDIRLAIDVDQDVFYQMLKDCCTAAGDGVELSFIAKEPHTPPTKFDDTNEFWKAFRSVMIDEFKYNINILIFAGCTDTRHMRRLGIPVINFSPINNTPILLHQHNEYLEAATYLQGIEIYKKIIPRVANV